MQKRMSSRVARGILQMAEITEAGIAWHKIHRTPKHVYADLESARNYVLEIVRKHNARVAKRASR